LLHSSYAAQISRGTRYPLVKEFKEIEKVKEKLEEKQGDEEFAICWKFDPTYIDECCFNGLLPMSIKIWGYDIMAFKCHTERCIIDFADFHFNKSTAKKSKNFYLTMNKDFDGVIKMLSQEHHSWLCPQLALSFKTIQTNPEKYRTKILTFELWTEKDELVAVEIGYLVGSIYTSLSGAQILDSSGSVQLAALGVFLENNNIAFWDMGMGMKYKYDMGGKVYPRNVFLNLYKKSRSDIVKLDFQGKKNAKELIASRKQRTIRIDFNKSVETKSTAQNVSTKNSVKCSFCEKSDAKSICSRCKSVWYCNVDCQKSHWKVHKTKCVAKN